VATPTLTSPPVSIPRCYYASDALMTPDEARIYVPCYATNNLVVVDAAGAQAVESIDLSPVHPMGMHVYDAAMTPDGSKIYLGDDLMDIIGVVDTGTNQVAGVIDFGREGAVNSIAISPDGTLALVAFEGGNSIGIIDVTTDAVQGYFEVQEEEFFYLVGFDSEGSVAYVVSRLHGGRIYLVDTTTFEILGRIDLGIEGLLHPGGTMAISPDDRYLYLTSGFNEGGMEQPDVGTNRLLVVDLDSRELADQIEIQGGPQRITLSSDGLLAYVSTFSAGKVVVVDLAQRSVLGEFDWGGLFEGQLDFKHYDLRQVVLHSEEPRGYLVGWDGGILATLDLEARLITGAVDLNPIQGAEPIDILITPDGTKAYVSVWGRYTPQAQNAVLVLDLQTEKVQSRIPIDGEPMRPSITGDGMTLYLPTGSSSVVVIDAASDQVVRTIVPGSEAHFFTDSALLEEQNKLYVSYSSQDGGGGVYVIDLQTESLIGDVHADKPVASLSLSRDGSLLFGSRILDPEGLLIVDTSTDQPLESLAPPEGTDYPEVGVFTAATGASPDGELLYWGTGPSFVHIVDIDTTEVLRTMAIFDELLTGLPIAPSGIGFSPDGARAYIPCLDAGYMVVWDNTIGELVAAVRVGVNPVAIAATPDGELAYVPNMLSEDISVIDLSSLEVVRTIGLGE
jgi:YVTN family beta-propeller protein